MLGGAPLVSSVRGSWRDVRCGRRDHQKGNKQSTVVVREQVKYTTAQCTSCGNSLFLFFPARNVTESVAVSLVARPRTITMLPGGRTQSVPSKHLPASSPL